MPDFSILVLSYNEEVHLPRLLESVRSLQCPVFVLDSGSTDRTVEIAESFGATVLYHAFENHPRQWDYALKNFPVTTPWIIGLDSDHIVSKELLHRLQNFRDQDMDPNISGIYFNRKNFFKGKWIRYGGYFPKYLLKMFRTGVGYSDLNENMDHRFIVPGQTQVWKDGYLVEENLKENKLSFWIEKHNRYSDLVAAEETERRRQLRTQTLQPRLFGSPDERIAFYKKLWWNMPLFVRPFIYFFYRYFFKLGILDGREGLIFHTLQAFWFRFVVDAKMDELMKKNVRNDKVKHL